MSTDSTLAGRLNDVKPEQPFKATKLMDVTVLAMLMAVRLLQP